MVASQQQVPQRLCLWGKTGPAASPNVFQPCGTAAGLFLVSLNAGCSIPGAVPLPTGSVWSWWHLPGLCCPAGPCQRSSWLSPSWQQQPAAFSQARWDQPQQFLCPRSRCVCLCLVGFSWGPDPSEAPSLVPWLTFIWLQHCTMQQLGWERGTPLLPMQWQARPLARCNVAGRPTALVTAAATSASWHQSSCAALLATLIYLSPLINELNKPTSLLAVPLVLQGLPAPNTRGGHEA